MSTVPCLLLLSFLPGWPQPSCECGEYLVFAGRPWLCAGAGEGFFLDVSSCCSPATEFTSRVLGLVVGRGAPRSVLLMWASPVAPSSVELSRVLRVKLVGHQGSEMAG